MSKPEPWNDKPFNPDWKSPPGATLSDWMKEQNATRTPREKVTYSDIADKLKLTIHEFCDLLEGKHPITYELAYRLTKTITTYIGAPSSIDFWLNREDDYRGVPRRSEEIKS